jgi:hypothetical protein
MPVIPFAAALLLMATTAGPARGHPGGTTGYASIAISPGSVRYSLTLWPATLPPPVADPLRRAQAGDAASADVALAMIRGKVTMVADGRRCEPGPGALRPAAPPAESLTLDIQFACADDVRDLRIRDDLPDVLGADYHTLARIDAPGLATQFAFASDARETRVSGGRGVASFALLGVEHILVGWDHLLFLLGLLLCGGGWIALAKIITAFTLAHSITLTLAVLDVLVLPDRLVEAVIALSIAFVAAENLVQRSSGSRRWLVAFCFGLVHGFGFASVVRDLGLPAHGLALSLLGFNAGVEVGQALVVALVLPPLIWLRRTRWEPRVIQSGSVAILMVGVVLFVERALS